MAAVVPSGGSSGQHIEVNTIELPVSGAVTQAHAAAVSAEGAANGAQCVVDTASGAAAVDGISTAITAAMSTWPAERSRVLAAAAAAAAKTATGDTSSAAGLAEQDAQNAVHISSVSADTSVVSI